MGTGEDGLDFFHVGDFFLLGWGSMSVVSSVRL